MPRLARHFLQDMLPDEDAVLYVDADTLFLNPIEELWDVFGKMNEGQLIALVPEIEDEANNWYKLEDEHPYVHPFGMCLQTLPLLLKLFCLRHSKEEKANNAFKANGLTHGS